MIIPRHVDYKEIQKRISAYKVTALLGPRQSGKTTLAGQFRADHYFDLENPRDLARFRTPQLTLERCSGLTVIDEIQRKPELFPLIRFLVDSIPEQRYLILGSASRDLIRQSSESLAGRISYYTLMGFSLQLWYINIGKRLVKRPKLYFRDSGIFHALLAIETEEALYRHPKLGSSWEGFALECVWRSIGKSDEHAYFWATHSG
ncbi:MAG: ATP-binding protein, partial [Desulfobacterales bacterium]|nr:ATP-binding protein [Desulfobacterales bacterium]